MKQRIMEINGRYKARSGMFLSQRRQASRRWTILIALLACVSIGFVGLAAAPDGDLRLLLPTVCPSFGLWNPLISSVSDRNVSACLIVDSGGVL